MTESKPLFSKILILRVIGSAANDRSHAEISFRIGWWGSWVLVTSEVTRHMNDDSGNSGIPRTFRAFQESKNVGIPRIQKRYVFLCFSLLCFFIVYPCTVAIVGGLRRRFVSKVPYRQAAPSCPAGRPSEAQPTLQNRAAHTAE